MFGYLKGSPHDRQYRQLYAWCCSSQRDWLGMRSLPFISYESIFACAVAVDLRLIAPPDSDSVTCCKTRKRHSSFRRDESPPNQAVAKFNAAFAMLLAGIKLDDDVQDTGSLASRATRRLFSSPIEFSRAYFRELDPSFDETVSECLAEHERLEKGSRHHAIDQYAIPTGKAFGYVFSLLPKVIRREGVSDVPDQAESTFATAGRLLGESLIAFDCGVDFDRDRRTGQYNPLRHRGEVPLAMNVAQQRLVELGWTLLENERPQQNASPSDNSLSEKTLSDNPLSKRILQHRILTLAHHRERLVSRQSKTRQPTRPMALPFLSLTTAKQRRGDCDCIGDICCEVGTNCDGCGKCLNLADCCDIATFCPCDACCAWSGNDDKKSKTLAAETSPPRTGTVKASLSPYGTISLEDDATGNELAAKSNGGVIEAGQRVEVIRQEAFGLLVRPIKG